MAVIHLIRRPSQENVLWGAPRIVDELALLGHTVAESTVAKYMVRHRPADLDQSWKTFLHNHMAQTAACDFFAVPTVTFQRLFCFVVMSLDRRRKYAAYYNESRTHSSLDGNSPIARRVEQEGEVVATPVLGGLHHRYSRAA